MLGLHRGHRSRISDVDSCLSPMDGDGDSSHSGSPGDSPLRNGFGRGVVPTQPPTLPLVGRKYGTPSASSGMGPVEFTATSASGPCPEGLPITTEPYPFSLRSERPLPSPTGSRVIVNYSRPGSSQSFTRNMISPPHPSPSRSNSSVDLSRTLPHAVSTPNIVVSRPPVSSQTQAQMRRRSGDKPRSAGGKVNPSGVGAASLGLGVLPPRPGSSQSLSSRNKHTLPDSPVVPQLPSRSQPRRSMDKPGLNSSTPENLKDFSLATLVSDGDSQALHVALAPTFREAAAGAPIVRSPGPERNFKTTAYTRTPGGSSISSSFSPSSFIPPASISPPRMAIVHPATAPPTPVPPHQTPKNLPPPHLTHRFSLTLSDGSARLSPSIIARHPPMPFLHLPTLASPATVSTPAHERQEQGENRRKRSRARLRSMPALPISGTGRGVGVGEGDGVEGDGDEDEDEDEAELEGDDGGSSTGHEDEDGEEGGVMRPSFTSSGAHGSGDADSVNSYHTGKWDLVNLPTPSPSEIHPSYSSPSTMAGKGLQRQLLPHVDTSRIEIDFASFDSPVKDKGKGKGKWTPKEDETPTMASSAYRFQQVPHDYFSTRGQYNTSPRLPQKDFSSGATSPTRTPRPGDVVHSHRFSFVGVAPEDVLSPSSAPLTGIFDVQARPGIYKHASRSLIDVTMSGKSKALVGLDEEDQSEALRPLKGKAKASEGDGTGEEDDRNGEGRDTITQKRLSKSPSHDVLANPLRRRRSMPMFTPTTHPPPYPSFAPHPYPQHPQHIAPTPTFDFESEGKEQLPPYTNSIYLKAVMPRKMEFTEPGVQAKDRKWRRVVCVLEGTVLKVYRCPKGAAGVGVLGEWWERKVGVGDASDEIRAAPGAGASGPEAGAEDRGRQAKWEERERGERVAGDGQTEVLIPSAASRAQQPPPQQQHHQRIQLHPNPPQIEVHHQHISPPTSARSRLNIVGHLLKPHGRSHSDVPNPPRVEQSPRPSLNLPRPSVGSPPSAMGSRPESRNSGAGTLNHASHLGSSSPNVSVSASLMPSIAPTSASSESLNANQQHQPHGLRLTRAQTPMPAAHTTHEPAPADLMRAYTMQNAESGLGNDYVKRKNVIRVRLEGEQFLLQAKDVGDVVEWIEVCVGSFRLRFLPFLSVLSGPPLRHEYRTGFR